ncbi:peptide ABC transporter ATP-binding protein [Fervidicella metallireducens AeB]|uniref:Peptide ABC transporter ATP-binding protein n=1 Tax=Fervidicella metallireducens AeB TaxID=1403537 RepID=A0A017RT23_9CLOT|nr:ABC transporter ATP-binding protein [Fervidicella metallireducens]EYE87822.1 peptide ABC transporter ATP-binding protein [Fervidicella metallireducens AeB]
MEKLLKVQDLHTSFFTYAGEVKAVRGISFDLDRGEAIGIVGESGCGKSVTMMSILRLLTDTGKIKKGNAYFEGRDLTKLTNEEMLKIRGNEISMIFQDPMTSLNPVFTIGDQLREPLIRHKKMNKAEASKKAIELLRLVGIPEAEKRLKQYPHEFSGGMRQRVMIAMALACDPKLVIADEPTTALDVTIQAQILELMKELKNKINTSIILITHDLGVVADLCNRINVMYGGIIVESGDKRDIFYRTAHPYTLGLLKSVPNPKTLVKERLKPIDGQPPDLIQPPIGCPFTPRCQFAMKICAEKQPPYFEINEGHRSACWLNHPDAPRTIPSLGRGRE